MTTANPAIPNDFNSYWETVLDELRAIPPAPEVEELPLRSTDFATAYGVRLTSIGPYRIYGYLSVPKGDGPFPVRYYLPRYGSVVDLVPQGTANSQRREHITFAICVRGQRLADQPYAAAFPGLLTDGIDDPMTYIYRGIVADCYRGLEYLESRPDVDLLRIATIGNDLALISAALFGGIALVVCAPALFYNTLELARRTTAYPLEEINDYLRLHPDRQESVAHTLSYFDLRRFVNDDLHSDVLLMAGAPGSALDPAALAPLADASLDPPVIHASEHSGYKDGRYIEERLAWQFAVSPSLPPHWQI